jgi:arginyl-tRNA--protein-N-Asp/Glu arginylyltransferase
MQQMSHWPAWPLPAGRKTSISGKNPCGYLSGRLSMFRAFDAQDNAAGPALTGTDYQLLMDRGFRRSGTVVYQPMCAGCRACVPMRVLVETFVPTRSQRRVMKANKEIVAHVAPPEPTREKWEMYDQYQREWHKKPESQRDDIASFIMFLYQSPVETVEFEYRDRWGKLLGVGICDVCPQSISSVYFYFDPREAWRSLGTFSALYEIEWAKQMKLPYWYAGYWVQGCAKMEYKSRFGPAEILGTDGVWRAMEQAADVEDGVAADERNERG